MKIETKFDKNIVDNLCNFFLNLEERLDLLNGKTEISTIWERIRQEISDEIKELINERNLNFENRNRKISLSNLDKLHSAFKKTINILINAIFYNPLFTFKKPNYIFFTNSRRVLGEDGKFHDIYTDALTQELPKNETMSIEEPWNFQHYRPIPTENIKYSDFLLLLSYAIGLIKARPLNNNTKKIFDTIETEILKNYNVNINIKNKALKTLSKRNGVVTTYRLLFRWLKPKFIFYISLNTDLAIIEAAHFENIIAIELQHGVLGFSTKYPRKSTIKSLPNYLFTFGKYWCDDSKLPIANENWVPIGFPFLSNEIAKYSTINKLDQVIYISQVSKQLAISAVLLAKSKIRPQSILFRLRPSEFASWRTSYPELLKAHHEKLLTVVDNDFIPIYQMLAESKYQVGISSMLLFEGLAFRCRTIILKTWGYEYASSLVNNGFAIYSDPDTVIDLHLTPEIDINLNTLFNDNWKLAFKNALSKIRNERPEIKLNTQMKQG